MLSLNLLAIITTTITITIDIITQPNHKAHSCAKTAHQYKIQTDGYIAAHWLELKITATLMHQ